jgi:hypothetical protein
MSEPSDDTLIARAALSARDRKLLEFHYAHPELKEALATWMVARRTCETQYPEAAEIFKREMPEFASDA